MSLRLFLLLPAVTLALVSCAPVGTYYTMTNRAYIGGYGDYDYPVDRSPYADGGIAPGDGWHYR
jgi:hypothetical protein